MNVPNAPSKTTTRSATASRYGCRVIRASRLPVVSIGRTGVAPDVRHTDRRRPSTLTRRRRVRPRTVTQCRPPTVSVADRPRPTPTSSACPSARRAPCRARSGSTGRRSPRTASRARSARRSSCRARHGASRRRGRRRRPGALTAADAARRRRGASSGPPASAASVATTLADAGAVDGERGRRRRWSRARCSPAYRYSGLQASDAGERRRASHCVLVVGRSAPTCRRAPARRAARVDAQRPRRWRATWPTRRRRT